MLRARRARRSRTPDGGTDARASPRPRDRTRAHAGRSRPHSPRPRLTQYGRPAVPTLQVLLRTATRAPAAIRLAGPETGRNSPLARALPDQTVRSRPIL